MAKGIEYKRDLETKDHVLISPEHLAHILKNRPEFFDVLQTYCLDTKKSQLNSWKDIYMEKVQRPTGWNPKVPYLPYYDVINKGDRYFTIKYGLKGYDKIIHISSELHSPIPTHKSCNMPVSRNYKEIQSTCIQHGDKLGYTDADFSCNESAADILKSLCKYDTPNPMQTSSQSENNCRFSNMARKELICLCTISSSVINVAHKINCNSSHQLLLSVPTNFCYQPLPRPLVR